MSRVFLIPLVVVLFHLVCATSSEIADQKKTSFGTMVHIISGVPDNPTNLRVNCTFDGTDFQKRTLNDGQEFSWGYSDKFFDDYEFLCKFNWGTKTSRFPVLSMRMAPILCAHYPCDCYWVARADGFYFSNDKKSWKKMYEWF
ncbi:S-protein homolog 29-like [Rhododendron vialii]|uniref:S-protein homolog 29-like n=1 Tax=Rhododendron vialii TaxID=182163 RepID=UPI00265D91B3|nr:S-protein homolog 29-like [Rhododendron vialii]